jgi:two-component system NtrC family sensor kinase
MNEQVRTDQELIEEISILKKKIKEFENSAVCLKLVEEAIKESEKRLHSIIDGFPIPAFVIEKDHRIIHWNKALEEMSKIKSEEVVGTRDYWKAFYSEKRPCLAVLLVDEAVELLPWWYDSKYIKSPLIEDAYEATDFFPTLGENGKWLRFTAAAIRDSKGMIVAAIETLEDITERTESEQSLRESYRRLDDIIADLKKANHEKQKQLVQSEKLSSLGQLVSGCAHEINNPIQFILGNMSIFYEAFEQIIAILDKQAEENPNLTLARLKYPFFREHIKTLLDDMTNGAKRIRDIVADLKTFARRDEGRLDEEVNINEVVRVCIRLVHNKIKRYRIEEDLDPTLPTITGSPNKLEQVVIATIINAAEALGDRKDGTIKITTRIADIGLGICLSIADNGEGMTAEIKNRIFDPFFTTKQRDGTGLGLSISYGIIGEHGGHIEVESEPGKGATFRFHLPVKRKDGVENKKERKPQSDRETIYNIVSGGTFDYNFNEQKDVQAFFVRKDIPMGCPKMISLYAKGDGSLHMLGLAYRDKLDQTYTVSFTENALHSTDWHLVSARIPDNAKFPLKMESIYVLKNNKDFSHKNGTIELDGISAHYLKE